MRLQCMMRVQFGDVIHEVGEVIERDYEEAKQAIRDRALMPLPDLPKEAEKVTEVVSNVTDSAKNAFSAAVKQPEPVNNVFTAPSVSSDTSEVEES